MIRKFRLRLMMKRVILHPELKKSIRQTGCLAKMTV